MKTSQRGFTIVELILVVVIIGILAAVVGPRFFDRDSFDERIYFEEVLSTVRYAQKLAVASGCRMQVSRTDSGKFLLHRDKNCEKGTSLKDYSGAVIGADGQDYSDLRQAAEMPQGLTVVTDPKPFLLVFGSLGCIPGSTPGTCDEGKRRVTVDNQFTFTVHAATGLIEVGR